MTSAYAKSAIIKGHISAGCGKTCLCELKFERCELVDSHWKSGTSAPGEPKMKPERLTWVGFAT
jgi:hypothetical protein